MTALSKFLGIHNTDKYRNAFTGHLADAVNIDIDNAGAAVRRPGYTLSKALTIAAAHATLDKELYVVSSGVLYRVDVGLNLHTIGETTATAFADFGHQLFSNTGQHVFHDELTSLVVPTPSLPELLVTGGSRPIGRYSVVATYINDDGLESGTSDAVTVELTTPGEILALTDDPHVTVYITESGGEVFYSQNGGVRLNEMLIGAGSFPSNVSVIEYYDSRLYTAVYLGDGYTRVLFSKPYQFHLFDYEADQFIVSGVVSAMASTPQGLIIATSSEVFLYTDGNLVVLADYGVVPGRPIAKLPNGSVMILTTRGVCSALPFAPITENDVSLPLGTQCNTAIVYNNGIKKFIALHDSGGVAFNTAT